MIKWKLTFLDPAIFDHLIDDDVGLFDRANEDLLAHGKGHETLTGIIPIDTDLEPFCKLFHVLRLFGHDTDDFF